VASKYPGQLGMCGRPSVVFRGGQGADWLVQRGREVDWEPARLITTWSAVI
jgi:hypothetical protein